MESAMQKEMPDHSKMFSKEALVLDAAVETNKIVSALDEIVHQKLHKQGAVVAISGGIDSSVVLALCVRAFGPDKVLGLLLPEKESSPESADLAHELADHFGVQTITEEITPVLDGFGCYQRRNEAVARIFPQFQEGWLLKIVLPGDLLEQGSLNLFQVVVTDPQGNEYRQRLPLAEYRQIVASSNFKQRTRTNFLYYHAELRNYAVIGTPNKNEHDLGFFVKYGDGGYDFGPIRHLFKTQVFQLADYLDVPKSISSRPPTTDTYPGGGTQEEFFYRIKFDILDTIWLGIEKGIPSEEIAAALSLDVVQVERVTKDIQQKKRATDYLRWHSAGLNE
jgi:NAD+ synthase